MRTGINTYLPLFQTTKVIEATGNVYFVGDIHGYVDLFWEGLEQLNFDKEKDIVVALGDLVDRGSDSLNSLRLVNNPWFYSVAGNHECKIYTALHKTEYRYGMDDRWLKDMSEDEKTEILQLMELFHWTIEVKVDGMRMGAVHADIPENMSWDDFVSKTESGNDDVYRMWCGAEK
mgnify:CR=1 FL=1|jgi:serine/threonine protein phosphatase 1|tara:strand:+ start:4822 stop:5346 length:525 start_codon:yes stop_codon:yes gene_type:complete